MHNNCTAHIIISDTVMINSVRKRCHDFTSLNVLGGIQSYGALI